jgi:AcrR family transcriptional regulator
MTVSAGGVPLRERQRQEREALILRAAADLFVERGYHETLMEDIAARVGIAKGTVYLHFASKEDLTMALIHQGIQRFAHELDAILAADGSPRAKLQTILERAYGARDDGLSQVIATAFRNPEMLARMHEKRATMGEMWREPSKSLSELLNAGKAAGEFDRAMPTPIMLNLLLGLLAPHRWERSAASDMTTAEIARHVSRFFFKGIAPDQPSEHAPPPGEPLEVSEAR